MSAASTALWHGRDVALATGGDLVGNWQVSGLSIDTRTLRPGELFVPLKDARDGHEFIPAAFERGAGAVISEHPMQDVPAICVSNSQAALEALAIEARRRSKAVRIAVTGSVGKTSVKEMLASALSAAGRTHKSIKSYNNHWGVPLMLASMPVNTEFGVFETGMNHAGELSALSKILVPDIAIITKIAPAHMEHFKSLADIAAAKSEIFDSMVPGAIAVLNRDDEFYEFLAQRAAQKGLKIVTAGQHERADVRFNQTGDQLIIHSGGMDYAVKIRAAGSHHVQNAMLAFAAAGAANADLAKAARGLSQFTAPAGRGAVHSLRVGGKAVTLIDESYNANPESMRAAIASMDGHRGRKIAVLGDMLELGAAQNEMHAALASHLRTHTIDRVLTCGARMRHLERALEPARNAGWSTTAHECLTALRAELRSGDIVMIKGSNGSKMHTIVSALTAGEAH